MAPSSCWAPAAISRASELTVTNWKPLAMRARRRLGPGVVDAGHHAVGLGPRQDVVHRLRGLWRQLVHGRLAAQRQRQVGRADVDRVQPFHRQDGVQVVECGGRLDHREAHDGGVGMLGIVGAAVQQRAHRAEAAGAARRIGGVGHQLLRFFTGADHGADHTVGAGVQCLHQDAGLQPGHPHHRHGGGGADGLQHGEHGLVIHHAVLQVDGERIPALVGHHLGRKAVGNGQPAIDSGAAGLPQGAQGVGSHGAQALM